MIDKIFNILKLADDFYWGYIGFFILVLSGLYLSYRSKFYQFRVMGHLPKTIRSLASEAKKDKKGISPIKLYFASIGGMIGLGNIVGVITALLVGGPGALLWLWVASIAGMLIKYSEIFLGIRYRKARADGYDGGPMYILPHAFKGKLGLILANVSAVLLCIYGVEIFQFTVITDTLQAQIPLGREWIIGLMLAFTIYIGLGGIRRLANFCTVLMPVFMILYGCMCLWVIFLNASILPDILLTVVKSAFVGHAPLGGFAGSTFIMAAQMGAARAVYSGDIAIGFDAIIQSETRILNPQRQARLAILSMISDSFICTMSILVVLITGLWTDPETYPASQYVARALSLYFPYVNYIVTAVIFLAGFTTIQAYFAVGLKSAKYLSEKWGKLIYFIYALVAFWGFAHFDQTQVILIMSLSGGGLILINLSAILRLRKEIKFDVLIKEDATD